MKKFLSVVREWSVPVFLLWIAIAVTSISQKETWDIDGYVSVRDGRIKIETSEYSPVKVEINRPVRVENDRSDPLYVEVR